MCSERVGSYGGFVPPGQGGFDDEVAEKSGSGEESSSGMDEVLNRQGIRPDLPPRSARVARDEGAQQMGQPPPLNAHQAQNDVDALAADFVVLLPNHVPVPAPVYPTGPTMTLQVPMPGGAPANPWTPGLAALGPDLAAHAQTNGPNRAAVEQAIQQKINDGAVLANQLVNLAAPKNPAMTEKDVTDLAWYLQARGELRTGTTNAPGITYTLPDPHGHIRTSLDRVTSNVQGNLAYQRASSHLQGFQAVGGSAAPRGANMIPRNATDYDRVLPHGNETLLYQRMAQGVNGFPSERIFLKPESHGMWGSNPSYGTDPNGPVRGHLQYDRRHGMSHSFSFVSSFGRQITGNNNPPGSFKERVPETLVTEYKALIRAAPAALQPLLSANQPGGESSGVHVMRANLDAVFTAMAGPNGVQTTDKFQNALHAFNGKYLNNADPVYDNPHIRIGQEIILEQQDL